MDIEEYKKRLNDINEEANAKERSLAKEYALSHNPVKIGDVIEDHIGRIEVEKINFERLGELPRCVYFGIEITKAGNPSKKGTKRWVYQTNLKI